MKIVVLDDTATNPGRREWTGLSELGDCTIYDTTPEDPAVIVSRIKDAEAIIVGTSLITEDIIRVLPKLKYIGVTSTGYNVVDVVAAKKKGITVTNVPDFSTSSVLEYVFSSIFALIDKTHVFDKKTIHNMVRNNGWDAGKTMCTTTPYAGLAGKTMGIIGLGKIGSAVAKASSAFGMQVIYYSRSQKKIPGISLEYHKLDDVFRDADFVSLHCPLTRETKDMVSAERLTLMKPSAILINTARGGVVDEKALFNALLSNQIQGAVLDVFTKEPAQDNPLFKLNNCLLSPHVAWSTINAQKRLLVEVINNLRCFVLSEPRNVITDDTQVLLSSPSRSSGKSRKNTATPPSTAIAA